MIFYVEDDQSIRELVLYTLNQAGFQTRGFECGDGLLEACRGEKPELVLLDIMLPGTDGSALLRILKENKATCDIPVIMLTAKGTEYDKVIGLDAGADDYMVKPFGMMELVSRVRTVLRRGAPKARNADPVYENIRMDIKKHAVFVSDQPIGLTIKEYELLRLFMENPDRAFTRGQLLDIIWEGGYYGGTRTVDVHIQTLRQKLDAAGSVIETVRGVGYRLGGRS